MTETLLLFDGSNVMMRAHFAVPHLTTKKGFPVGAIKGSINIVESLYRRVRPSHVSFVFDRKEKTHRHRIFKAYKGTRKRDPKVAAIVKPQRRPLYDLLTAMGIYVLHKSGYEADDLIGTACAAFLAQYPKGKVIIVSNDKDFAQLLVNKRVTILKYNHKDKTYTTINHKNCEAIYGVPPNRIVDMLMIMGDKVDNIPGIPGIGEKSIARFLNGDQVEHADTATLNKAQRASYEDCKGQFRLTRRLVTIHTTILPLRPDRLKLKPANSDMCHIICKQLEAEQLDVTVKRFLEVADNAS